MDARDYMGPSKIKLKPEQIIKNTEEVVDLSRFAGKPKSQHVKGVDKKPVTRITSESNVDKAIKQQGDVLITFDLDKLKKECKEAVVPVIVTNSKSYLDILKEQQNCVNQDELMFTLVR